ncbi:MAG: rod shape-determining protein MreC [Acetobacter sp.]|nr:rod shape-determining protein MreC [Acetobacter sp.]
MLPFSVQTKQFLNRLTFLTLLLLSVGIIIIGQFDKSLTNKFRMAVISSLMPLWNIALHIQTDTNAFLVNFKAIHRLTDENRQLQIENTNLRQWYDVAVSLARENRVLKTELHWNPEPSPSFVTSRVIADRRDIYTRTVLLMRGTKSNIHLNDLALTPNGLVGRITEIGPHIARVLLITDSSSRIPVELETSHVPAIMVGNNTSLPRLLYYPQNVHPIEGERVVTLNQDSSFPTGIPIGTVHYQHPEQPTICPFAHLEHLAILRVFDFHQQPEILSKTLTPKLSKYVPSTPSRQLFITSIKNVFFKKQER